MVSGKKSAMSNNHCARTSCWLVHACAPHLWFVYLPNWHFSLHLPPHKRPGMCAVDNFQRLRFGNSRSPDKFTGKCKQWFVFYAFLWTCQVTDYCQISSVGNCLLCICRGCWRGGRCSETYQLGRCTNQRWGAQAWTNQQDVLAQWLFDIAY